MASKKWDTAALIQGMMKDSKLTPFQIKQLNEILKDAFKSGKYRSFPLEIKPTSSEPDRPVVQKKDENCFGKKTYRYRKKKLKSILRDNPPERDDFVPLPPKFDREKEKAKLQRTMEYNGKPPRIPFVNKTKPVEKKEVDRFEELVREVEDRQKWLEEMRGLGLSKEHEYTIKAQIRDLVAEMQQIDKERSKQYSTNACKSQV